MLGALSWDTTNYLRSRMRLDQVSGSIADSVTQYQKLYNDDLAALFQTAQTMAGNVAVSGEKGATIITGISNTNGTPIIVWRKQTPGNVTYNSDFGLVGAAAANLPDHYALPKNSSVVAVEVFSAIHPWVLSKQIVGGEGSQVLRSVALFQPRAAQLPQLIAENRP